MRRAYPDRRRRREAAPSGGDTLDTADALRQTSDALLRDLDVLVALEDEKRSLIAGDPKVVELGARIEEIAARVLGGATRQRALGEVAAQEEEGRPDPAADPIGGVSRPVWEILADWRESERRLGSAEPGSADAIEAQALVDHLRSEYRLAQVRRSPGSS